MVKVRLSKLLNMSNVKNVAHMHGAEGVKQLEGRMVGKTYGAALTLLAKAISEPSKTFWLDLTHLEKQQEASHVYHSMKAIIENTGLEHVIINLKEGVVSVKFDVYQDLIINGGNVYVKA